MLSDNSFKSQHGANAQDALYNLFINTKENELITDFEKDYRTGRDGYSAKQFYAPFLIMFSSGEKWAIYSTTSLRTDRVKGQQWDAINLKAIHRLITKCYLVYPDSVDETDNFLVHGKKITESIEYSALDGVIGFSQLKSLIEEKALENKTPGQKKDRLGRLFENYIAEVLSSEVNLLKLKSNNHIEVGYDYPLFSKIISALNLIPDDIASLNATTKINKLPSGGSPKTDVLLKSTKTDGEIIYYTISCKRSIEKYISVHQYSSDVFANVLDKDNTDLRELLSKFQKAGGLREFGAENGNRLTDLLKPLRRKLALWVLGGKDGDGDPETQWARYMLTHIGETDCHIQSIESYYDALLSSDVKGHFGTIFIWTYASGSKGKSIQLKTKVL